MRKTLLISLVILALFTSCKVQKNIQKEDIVTIPPIENIQIMEDLQKSIEDLPGIRVERIPTNNINFKASFKLMIEQPVDHFDLSKGYFEQKVYLNHTDFNAIMVMNINGYSVPSNTFTSELVPWLSSNFMHVEHRFFGESIPANLDYSVLTIEQAANDHHRVIEILKQVYKGKWITTGISKGGQATIFHSMYFPDDADVSIPYVAPVNLAQEDTRLNTFLDQVGTPECRSKVLEFQRSILGSYAESLKAFENLSDEKELKYPMSTEKAFELSVLEYEFAYWQWSGGAQCDLIPGKEAEAEDLVEQLFLIDAPGFFTESSIEYFFPFFYQAYAELGMYGYTTDSLQGYLKEYDSYVSNYASFIPEKFNVEYNPEPLQKVQHYLENSANNFIFVYGENDAWSATAFIPDGVNTNSVGLVNADGSHLTRINDLSEIQKKIAFSKLAEWLEVKIIIQD
jgi:hypothetical protein